MKLNNNNYDLEEVERNGKDEMNIIELPLTTLKYQSPNDKEPKVYVDWGVDEHGRKFKLERQVTANQKYGHPGYSANKLLLVLMETTKEQNNFTNRKVFYSINLILKKMNLPNTKQYRDMVVNDMNCLGGLWVTYKKSFWDNKQKHYANMAHGILQGFHLPEKEKPGRKSSNAELEGWFLWNEVFFNESFLKNNLKSIDLNFALNLEYPLTLSVYRLLDKKRYFQSIVRFHLKTYAFEKLGMSRAYNTAQIKRYLNRANQELKDKKFLKYWKYEKDESGELWIIYYLREEKQSLASSNDQKASPQSKEQPKAEPLHPLAMELIKRRVSQPVAIKLVGQYPEADIQLQIEHHDYLLSIGKKIESAGWFVRAIPENWMPPVDFKSKAQLKQEEKDRIVKAQAQAQADQAKHEEEQRQWEETIQKGLITRKTKYNAFQYDDLWEQVKSELANAGVNKQSLLIWFSPAFICQIEDNIITINLPNEFMVMWHNKHYKTKIEQALLKQTKNAYEISYIYN